jgi:hypothetical protein
MVDLSMAMLVSHNQRVFFLVMIYDLTGDTMEYSWEYHWIKWGYPLVIYQLAMGK